MYPPPFTAGSNPTVQGSYYPGMHPASAPLSQSLGQGVTSTSGPAGDTTGVTASTQTVTAAYNYWLQHVGPYTGVAQGGNDSDPPAEFWAWFYAQSVQEPPSGTLPNWAPAQAQAQAQAQSAVAGLRQSPATAFGHPPGATSSTARQPAVRSYAYGMTAAQANPDDGRSQSQAGSAAHVRRRSSIRIDGPLTIVLQPGARTGSGRDGGRK
ncbi:hypothetical protein EXIGLDRAFT_705469 [Exidia glandulosa HHB12029]|uniref:Uncharacterized protein n=1 Tax=Exidia glandulosa HHB12029 TaxID=1314781 RepID=A0A165KKI7_EXIGL|nr:hypothetical protein EXIGLDRAFT_705469 [Exidia glandulosa HHB12029]